MKPALKESISRVLLIVFAVMMVCTTLCFLTGPGGLVLLYIWLAVLPIIALFITDKYREFICIELIVALLFITVDQIAGQRYKQEKLNSCYEKISELEKELEKYELAKE